MPIHYWSSLSWFELAFLTECDVNAVNMALFDGSMMSNFSLLGVSNWWRSNRSHHLKTHHALYRLTSVQGKLPCHCCKWFPDRTPLVYTCRVSKQHRHEKQNEKGEWSQRIRLGTSALKQKQGQFLPYKPVAMFPLTFLLRPCFCRSQSWFTCAKQPLIYAFFQHNKYCLFDTESAFGLFVLPVLSCSLFLRGALNKLSMKCCLLEDNPKHPDELLCLWKAFEKRLITLLGCIQDAFTSNRSCIYCSIYIIYSVHT